MNIVLFLYWNVSLLRKFINFFKRNNGNGVDNETYQIYFEAYESANEILRSIARLQSYYYSSKVSILISLDAQIDELGQLKKEMESTLQIEASPIDTFAENLKNSIAIKDKNAENKNQAGLEEKCKISIASIVTYLGKINKSLDEMKGKILDESHIVKL